MGFFKLRQLAHKLLEVNVVPHPDSSHFHWTWSKGSSFFETRNRLVDFLGYFPATPQTSPMGLKCKRAWNNNTRAYQPSNYRNWSNFNATVAIEVPCGTLRHRAADCAHTPKYWLRNPATARSSRGRIPQWKTCWGCRSFCQPASFQSFPTLCVNEEHQNVHLPRDPVALQHSAAYTVNSYRRALG